MENRKFSPGDVLIIVIIGTVFCLFVAIGLAAAKESFNFHNTLRAGSDDQISRIGFRIESITYDAEKEKYLVSENQLFVINYPVSRDIKLPKNTRFLIEKKNVVRNPNVQSKYVVMNEEIVARECVVTVYYLIIPTEDR